MARTLSEIKRQMTDAWMSNPDVRRKYGFAADASFDDTFKKISLENILFYIFSYCIWLFEAVFDKNMIDFTAAAENLRPGTPAWYSEQIRHFLYGFSLLPGSTDFDTAGAADETAVEAAQIIKYAAVSELPNRLRIKIAGTDEIGNLTDISEEKYPGFTAAFNYYMEQIRYAGILFEIVNAPADRLNISLTVYYDPMRMDSRGRLLADQNAAEPVRAAMLRYIAGIQFTGSLIRTFMVDELQSVVGVKMPVINQINYKTAISENYESATGEILTPYAGWFALNSLEIIYTAYS